MMPFSQPWGGQSFTREDHREAALSSGRHRKTREGGRDGPRHKLLERRQQGEDSADGEGATAAEEPGELSALPCEATYISGFPVSNAEPVSRSTIHGDLGKKGRKGGKTGSRFRSVVDIGGAFRAGAAPGLFTAEDEGSAVLFCARGRKGGASGGLIPARYCILHHVQKRFLVIVYRFLGMIVCENGFLLVSGPERNARMP